MSFYQCIIYYSLVLLFSPSQRILLFYYFQLKNNLTTVRSLSVVSNNPNYLQIKNKKDDDDETQKVSHQYKFYYICPLPKVPLLRTKLFRRILFTTFVLSKN